MTMPISLRVQTGLASVLAGTPAGRAFTTQWILGIRPKRWRLLRERNSRGFRLILPPADRFYADPFVFEHRGRTCVFFEDYRFASMRAVISCMEVGRQGELSEPVVVLDGPDHISYPFIFRSNGVVYMIPETSSRKRVELHRCTSFPFEWELEDVLMDLPASDATLWHTDGTFWLFANMSAGTGGPDCEDLHVFFADSLACNLGIASCEPGSGGYARRATGGTVVSR